MTRDSGAPTTGSTKRRRRPRRRRKHTSGTSRIPSCMEKVEASIASAAREVYAEMFGPRSDRARPFSLDLRMAIEPGEPWRLRVDPSLEEQIRAAVREMATQAEAFRMGRVYCYRCDSPDCSHALPPTPTSVFGGYSSTGLPVWPEFSQMLLEQKHPRVGLLYEASQTDFVAMYVNPELLKQRQLNVFGRQSKTYDILGQVVFGFLKIHVPGADRAEPERVACTLQAVEFRRLDGSPRLALNVLARLSDGSPAFDAVKGPYQTRVADVISSARHRIGSLRPPPRPRAQLLRASTIPDIAALAEGILQGLARKLEKVGRQRGRRTAHAEGHRVKNRPTSKAWEDAFDAVEEAVLWDRHEETFVVIGPRNRVHVFSQGGRHVTSLILATEAVRSRKRRRRWLPLTSAQKEQFGSSIGFLAREASKFSSTTVSPRK